MARRGGQQGAIRHDELRPRYLPTQNLEFVAQHQQLDVFHVQSAAATDKRPEQRPHGEIEKGESHAADPPSPAPHRRDSNFGALQANERSVVQWSLDRGLTWQRSANPNGAASSDRPDFPAVAVSPDSSDVYLTYQAFHAPWQSTTTSPRLQEGVVRHADFAGSTLGAFADLHRRTSGDARGSSQNNLAAEFLGDYNYAAATNTYGKAVWNDVRQAADCPAIDAYRTAFIAFVTSSGAQPADEDLAKERQQEEKDKPFAPATPPTAPEPNNDCTQTPDLAFGNSDIWGGSFADPTP